MTDDLLHALGEADANMYLCSKDIQPSETENFVYLLHNFALLAFIS